MNLRSKKAALYVATGLAALAVASPVWAQDQSAEEGEEEAEHGNIVVTGTLIRGVEAIGSLAIDLGVEDIRQSGASTTNELLNEIPQNAGFNNRFDGDPRAADRLQVSRPNLRGLPGVTSATGATTLILVDGHRMTPMGVNQASFDPDFISPGAIERVEVVTDGGSSRYGADAVGGVINFVTRRSFDGIEATGGYEVGDDYDAWRAGITAGTTWSGGSAFVSYATFQRDELLNKDRDYAARGQWNADGTVLSPSGTQCLDPVGEITTWANFGAGWTNNPLAAGIGVRFTPVGTPCDIDAESSLLPDLERHSVLAGLSHELTDRITLDVKANFGDSSVRFSSFPLGDTISEPSPNVLGIPGVFGDTFDTAAVGFSYGANSAFVDRKQELDLRVYGITPEITFELDNDWQVRTTAHLGRSENQRTLPSSNRALLLDAVAAGDFDPLDVAGASPAVVSQILDFEVAGETNQELVLFRAVADGAMFNLGDDAVRMAMGVEYNHDSVAFRSDSVEIGGLDAIPFRRFGRDVVSAFGELSIPLFSIVDVSLSARFDDYSDFGSTFNPNVGLSVTPIEGLRIFGHWGESFNAPTALDAVRTANARFIANAAAGVPDPNDELTGPNDDVLLVEGSGGRLRPQSADTWSVGAEFEPVSNLVFGVNYYDIDFTDLLGAVNPQLASVVLLNPDKFIFNPTQAEFDAFLAATTNGVEQFSDINAADVGVIIDRRVANIGQARLKGLDFSANYVTDIGFGDLNLGVNGNHTLTFNITENGNTVDQLEFDVPDLNVQAYAGLSSGGFSSRVTVNHTNGFDTNIAVNQTRVESFTVADLFLGYEFGDSLGVGKGLMLTLNVDNVFDTDPPVFRQQRNLNFSGFTLGRIFKLGARISF